MIEKFWEYAIIVLAAGWIVEGCQKKELENNVLRTLPTNTIECKAVDKKGLLRAFMYVESTNNSKAINKHSKASGVLQIMPIMVREANRLSGYDRFTLGDRFDVAKSTEIFQTIMENKNPNYDIAAACKIWNPRGGSEYYKKIENTYFKILEEME